MSKFLKALELGIEILHDVEQLLAGHAASFAFTWGGRKFTVTIDPKPVA